MPSLERGHLRTSGSPVEQVAEILQDYADRGVFRGFSKGDARFKVLWHRERLFEFSLDVPKSLLRVAVVLPGVPRDSPMYAEFKEFVESRQADDLPAHRRIDRSKVRIRCGNRGGSVSLAFNVIDGDYGYAASKMVKLVHEIYLVFLVDGPYLEYMVEAFGLDPDRI
jgi:hypothetical protein